MLNRFLRIMFAFNIGIYSWPLIFKIPKTLRILFESFRSGGFGISNNNFWAFSRVDAAFRPWYTKIAKDYNTQGRFGYVWDDGLGMPLGVRIYNNWATYRVLYLFGHRRMMMIGYGLMILATIVLVAMPFGMCTGILIGLLAAGSPLIIGAYTHQGKPEMFWWAFSIPVVYFALSGNGLWAGLCWSGLSLLNLSISYMIILLVGPAFLFVFYIHGALSEAIMGGVPGIFKNSIRLLYMWRSGFMAGISSEQARLWKRPIRPTDKELMWWFPFVSSIVFSTFTAVNPVVGLLIIGFSVGMYWFNWRVIYINDTQSFHILFYLITLTYACVNQSLPGLLIIFFLLYPRPSSCGIPINHPTASKAVVVWNRRIENALNEIRSFPNLGAQERPQPEQLMQFFAQIPHGSRIIAESDGDPRVDSKFRAFWQWTEEFLPVRQVDLVNEIYTRIVESELVDKYLLKFNAQHMTIAEMLQICRILGVSYIVTNTQETTTLLESAGYRAVGSVDLAVLDDFLTVVTKIPPVKLNLFKILSTETVVSPAAPWSRKGNELKWQAIAGQSYVIRYRYAPEFQAYQKGHKLEVRPFRPLNDLPLQFMQVSTIIDGPVVLNYQPRWF